MMNETKEHFIVSDSWFSESSLLTDILRATGYTLISVANVIEGKKVKQFEPQFKPDNPKLN